MSVSILQLLAQHGGILALIIGTPFVLLCAAVVVLWRHNNKSQNLVIKLVQQKVETDIKLEAALIGLKEVIQAQGKP